MDDAKPILELVDVTRQYDAGDGRTTDVLRGISLRVERGASVAVVGPSGSGKSTLLNIIGGLDRPTSGAVYLEGDDLAAMDAEALATVRNRRIGFVFQSHHLLPQCTALENVLIPTLVHRRGTSDTLITRATRLLEEVGLGARLTHRPGQLSGGECQRVAVVRALINDPAVLLADEPTGSLDTAAADDLGQLLLDLNTSRQVTLIVVTHATRLADRLQSVLELRDGALPTAEVTT